MSKSSRGHTLGLGIGIERGQHEGLNREWLYWYDEMGNRHPAPENVVEQERQLRIQAERARLEAEQSQLEAEQARLEAEQSQLEAEHQAQQEQVLRAQAEQLARTLILRQLTRRVGKIPDSILNQINRLSMPQLDALGEASLDFTTIADLESWL